jgi:homoserine trans-succinylase
MKTYDLSITKYEEITVSDYDGITITDIPIEEFSYPETFGTADIANVLAIEDTDDLKEIFENLQKILKKQKINFKFSLKNIDD